MVRRYYQLVWLFTVGGSHTGNDRDRWHEMSNGVDGLKEEVEKKTPAIAMQWSILHTTPVKE